MPLGRLRLAGRRSIYSLALVALSALTASAVVPSLTDRSDPSGTISTYNTLGTFDTSNPFFQSLGTNGRSCGTCHLVGDAMGLSSASAHTLFTNSHGHDPLFADVDGANCRGVDAEDAAAHSLLTGHGLIRVALPIPADAEYTVNTVYDPYGCADITDAQTGQRMLSQYRRPLPSTNLGFLSAVMFDGRETVAPLNNPATFKANLVTNLTHQAIDATFGHGEAAVAPTNHQVAAIVKFEMSLFTAQSSDRAAGALDKRGGTGGPTQLVGEKYYPGINDSLGSNATGEAFTSGAFHVFDRWRELSDAQNKTRSKAREEVAAGEKLFNTFPLTIRQVGGLNDALQATAIPATCTTCHDTPNVGNHSLPLPLDIGIGHSSVFESDSAISNALAMLDVPDLPIFKVTCTAPPRTVYANDLGKALVSGLCADLIRLKGPILRGLAARAPYFHNGAAATLRQVVNFYDQRFEMGLSEPQKQQLEAFLRSL